MHSRLGRVLCLVVLCVVGSLSHAQALTYSEWMAGYPALTGNATLANADPDLDGLPNLLEYALDGCDPTVQTLASNTSRPSRSYITLRDGNGTYTTPTTTIPSQAAVEAAASSHLVIRYKPRSGVSDILYVPQTNQKDLNHWGWGDSAVTTWVDGDGFTWARTNSDMKVWQGRGFMRLRVEVIQ